MERYLKDEPKLQSYKKLPTELDTAPWNLFRAPQIWTATTGTTNAQFEPSIKMEVSNENRIIVPKFTAIYYKTFTKFFFLIHILLEWN